MEPDGAFVALCRRRSALGVARLRAFAVLVGVLALAAAALPATSLAVVPTDGGPLLNVTSYPINIGPGNQLHAHVDGDLVSYTSDDHNVRYYDFFTGDDKRVPAPPGILLDWLSDVSGSKIAFTRWSSQLSEILVYDTVDETTTTIAAGPGGALFFATIGANTVAYFDQGSGDVYAAEIGGGPRRG